MHDLTDEELWALAYAVIENGHDKASAVAALRAAIAELTVVPRWVWISSDTRGLLVGDTIVTTVIRRRPDLGEFWRVGALTVKTQAEAEDLAFDGYRAMIRLKAEREATAPPCTATYRGVTCEKHAGHEGAHSGPGWNWHRDLRVLADAVATEADEALRDREARERALQRMIGRTDGR